MRCNGYVLTSSRVDFWFDPRSCQPKNYTIGMCCFSSKHASLRRKTKTGWVGIRVMSPNGLTCLSVNCYFSGTSSCIYDTLSETLSLSYDTISGNL